MTQSTKRIIALIGVLIAAIIVVFLINQSDEKDAASEITDSNVAIDVTTPTNESDEVDHEAPSDLPTCELASEDVPNVPEGWVAHVFADSCIGIAFPYSEDLSAVSSGESSEWDGEYLRLTDNGDVSLSKKTLDMLVVDEGLYRALPERCSGYGYGTFPFCYTEILSTWERETLASFTVYRPQDDQITEQFRRPSLAFAAVTTDDGRFVTFHLYDTEDAPSSRSLLNKILQTLIIGSR